MKIFIGGDVVPTAITAEYFANGEFVDDCDAYFEQNEPTEVLDYLGDSFCDIDIDYRDTNLKSGVNKLAIRLKDPNSINDLNYILNGLNDVYGYISTNWFNIINIDSKKEKAIDFLLNLKEYEEVYVLGNEVNDYGMIEKYNGYIISYKKDSTYNTIKKFSELKEKL